MDKSVTTTPTSFIYKSCEYVHVAVMTAVVLSLLPFLIFEVLEGQVYNFLDESIQERMEWDLDRETKLSVINI